MVRTLSFKLRLELCSPPWKRSVFSYPFPHPPSNFYFKDSDPQKHLPATSETLHQQMDVPGKIWRLDMHHLLPVTSPFLCTLAGTFRVCVGRKTGGVGRERSPQGRGNTPHFTPPPRWASPAHCFSITSSSSRIFHIIHIPILHSRPRILFPPHQKVWGSKSLPPLDHTQTWWWTGISLSMVVVWRAVPFLKEIKMLQWARVEILNTFWSRDPFKFLKTTEDSKDCLHLWVVLLLFEMLKIIIF